MPMLLPTRGRLCSSGPCRMQCLNRNTLSNWFCYNDSPVTMKFAVVSWRACRKKRFKNSPCMREEVVIMAGRKGTREEPGTLTQGVVLFSLVPLVWESNPKLQGGWCKPNHQPIGGSDPKHQGIWSLPRAGQKFWKGQHDTVFTHRCWERNLFFSRSLTTKLQGCPCNKTPRNSFINKKTNATNL
jgi:hypothetical protein